MTHIFPLPTIYQWVIVAMMLLGPLMQTIKGYYEYKKNGGSQKND